jgi:hypothetical protein
LLIVVAGALLRHRDEALQICILGLPMHEQMQVIGHEAVRNYCKPFLPGSAQNLLSDDFHASLEDEHGLASIRADCQ